MSFSNPEDRPTAEELLNHEFVQQDTAFEFKVSRCHPV
jgi:hypothetical protein